MTTLTAYDAVLFISFGGPEKQEDVMPFLEHVTKGRGIPRERLLTVADHYTHLGGHSPINEITRRQAAAAKKTLEAQGSGLKMYIGQRHWHPFIEDTLRRMKDDGIKRAVGFITAAHQCEASDTRYKQAVEEARQRIGPGAPVVDYVKPWFDHPLFIEAIAERIRETSAPEQAPWYFVAHSIPTAMPGAETYVRQLERTAHLVAERCGKKEWTLAYSSRSGRPQDPWLSPSLEEAIEAETARGRKAILFITIGFVADHVEVLFDQDVEARAYAEKAGLAFYRTPTVGDHPLFIRLMAEQVLHVG